MQKKYHTSSLAIFNTCYEFIKKIPILTPDINHQKYVDTKLVDRRYDELSYALMSTKIQEFNEIK